MTLVEYGNFECSYCGMADPIMKEIQESMGDRLRLVFRYFPLAQIHPHAERAAEASEAAGAQGRFWEMHDLLDEHQRQLDDGHLIGYAERLGLETGRFTSELHAGIYAGHVREDLMSGVVRLTCEPRPEFLRSATDAAAPTRPSAHRFTR